MTISIQQLLGKIEKELNEAKGSTKDARMRESVHTIKSLCELILEEPGSGFQSSPPASPSYNRQPMVPTVPIQSQPATIQQSKPMVMEDDVNGESLFDF